MVKGITYPGVNRFSIAGLGNISSRHVEAIKKIGGEVLDTFDVDASRNPTCSTYEELLKSPAEWVVLLTPSNLHFEQAQQALKAGKRVIMEKPATLNAFDLDEFDIRDEVYVVSQLRYMQSIKDLHMKVMRDEGYNVRLNIIAHRDPAYLANWRGDEAWSGGLLYILGIHYFDLLTYIFGAVKSVHYVRWISEWKCTGKLELERATVAFNIEISETKPNYKFLAVNDHKVDLAAGFFELHGDVYQAIVDGEGIHPSEMYRAAELIDLLIALKPTFK